MTDISNKTLAVLVGIAIVVSVLGLLMVPRGGVTIVGAATNESLGAANITIQSITQIRLANRTVDFGSGFVNSSGNFCTLESNSSTKSAACSGFYSPANASNFVLENVGNVNVSVQINGTYANARAFLCNTNNANQNCTLAAAEYNYSVAQNEASACIAAVDTSWAKQLNTSLQNVCANFDFNSNANALNISLRLNIPRDSRQGTLNDTVTFLATTG